MVYTEEFLIELQSIEDAISAYENNYYDTHDLDYIEGNMKEYREKINLYSKDIPEDCNGMFYFCKVVDGKLVKK